MQTFSLFEESHQLRALEFIVREGRAKRPGRATNIANVLDRSARQRLGFRDCDHILIDVLVVATAESASIVTNALYLRAAWHATRT